VALRVAFGILWAVSAWFTCQPPAISALQLSLARAARNSSLLASPWLSFWLHIAIPNPAGFALGIALLEGCIALGLLSGMLTLLICGMGIALSILSWSTGALGLIAPAGMSSLAGDPGIALVCILACIGLALFQHPQTSRYPQTEREEVRTASPAVAQRATGYQGHLNKTGEFSQRISKTNIIRSRRQSDERERVLSSPKRG
jgi:hypothetical protein